MSHLAEEGPGPGAYNFGSASVRGAGPSYTIGSKKKRLSIGNSPGPGAYEPSSDRGHRDTAPSYTFGGKY